MEKNTRLKSHTKNEQVGFAQKNLKLIRRWKKIIQLFEDHDRDNEKLSDQKKTKAEEDVTKAEENEKAISGDLQGNSKKESEKSLKKKRASGSDTMNYLKETSEAEELELRRDRVSYKGKS